MNTDPDALFRYNFSLQKSGDAIEVISLYKHLLGQFLNEAQILKLLGAAFLQF